MQERQIQIETVKTYIQLASDDSKSVLLYGTIAVGLLALSLQILLDFSVKSKCYWIFLLLGVVGLLLGSIGFFWYSRELTRMNFLYGELLFDMTKSEFQKSEFEDRMTRIPIFKKSYVKFIVKSAKICGGVGGLLYLIAIILFLTKKLS